MSEILLCLTFTLTNVATVLPLDALRRLTPSLGTLVYSMEVCFDLRLATKIMFCQRSRLSRLICYAVWRVIVLNLCNGVNLRY